MPVTHRSKVFAVKDARIAKLTADAAGAAPTYGTALDVPGIKSVTVGGDVTSVELRGDNKALDGDSFLSSVSVSFEYAKLDLDVLGVLLGGTVVDAGVTPNQTATLGVTAESVFSYFYFEAVSVSADPIGGDVRIYLPKCKLTDFPELGMEEEDYRTFEVSAAAYDPVGTGNWFEYGIRETGALLTP